MSYTPKKQLSASLYRRLAEAADGIRNVEVYFIAAYAFPHAIKDFLDLESAKDYFSKHGFSENDYAIWGPFKTIDDFADLNLTGAENIVKVDLTIEFKDGYKQNVSLPGGIDSIFLSLSSFEKFVFPYYCHLYGVEYAKRLRANLKSQYAEYTGGNKAKVPLPKPHRAAGTYIYNLYETPEDPTSEGLPD